MLLLKILHKQLIRSHLFSYIIKKYLNSLLYITYICIITQEIQSKVSKN